MDAVKSTVTIERRGAVAVLCLEHAPVNALSAALRRGLLDALQTCERDPSLTGVVITGAGKGFCGGADISEFGRSPSAFRDGVDPKELTACIDRMSVPVVAAIHGFALGGGLELALGCTARVCAAGARLGLPEINLGLLPGAGGTQRLTRLVGAAVALPLMLSGQAIDTEEALRIGLVDSIVNADVLDGALEWLRSNAGAARSRARDRAWAGSALEEAPFLQAEQDLARRKVGRAAARHIVDCVRAALTRPFEAGMAQERAAFEACLVSPDAKALQHAFFAEREAGRIPGLSPTAAPRRVARVGVIGGGTMGRGIAMSFANRGYRVHLIELDAEAAARAHEAIAGEYRRLLESGRLTAQALEERVQLLQCSPHDSELQACDLVIEAVFEDMQLKRQVAERMGQVCRPGAILASNTSTLDIDVLADASGRAADFIGLHFFSPAPVMRLVEVVRGAKTSPEALATAVQTVKGIGKTPVVSAVCWGFIGNRMLEPYLRETEALLLEGVSPSRIDAALERYGLAMGPCRMMDLAGVDVVAKVVHAREADGALPRDPLYRVVCRELFAAGRLGHKSGGGFYRYEGRRPVGDEEACRLVAALAARHGVRRSADVTDEEIVDRCLLPLVNEGFELLNEGIAYRESDVDWVWLAGYGFPASRGGPLFDARRRGLTEVVERLQHFARAKGDHHGYWRVGSALARAAARVGAASHGLTSPFTSPLA
jgi:3-hydroxyacyl-CoA dehydrogenase